MAARKWLAGGFALLAATGLMFAQTVPTADEGKRQLAAMAEDYNARWDRIGQNVIAYDVTRKDTGGKNPERREMSYRVTVSPEGVLIESAAVTGYLNGYDQFVYASSKRYTFFILKDSQGVYTLAGVRPGSAAFTSNMKESEFQAGNSCQNILQGYRVIGRRGHIAQPAYLAGPDYTVSFAAGPEQLIRANYSHSGTTRSGKPDSTTGNYDLDPRTDWVVRARSTQYRMSNFTSEMKEIFDYLPPSDLLPLYHLGRSVTTTLNQGQSETDRHEWQYTNYRAAELPAEKLTLKYYGLPEVAGEQRPSRLPYYLTAFTLVCALLGLAFTLRRRRQRKV